MCGLAGILTYGENAAPADREELLRMRDNMRFRGPDGAGSWLSPDGRIALAHRRLAIIDLSQAGVQPMLDPETGNVIACNGEIYNYRALRAELEKAGARFRSDSDTEVLLKLYAAHGRAMLERLRGMYAFALWDAKQRGLLLVRDPFGIKPLYLADDGGTLRFASQVKALLVGGKTDTSPDAAGRVGFYLWGHIPEPFTLYKGIRALPAGTGLWVNVQGRKDEHRFFDLTSELCEVEEGPRTINEAHEILRASLRDTVRYHLVADVPVGVFLSAGIDSSTITALAAEAGGSALRTLTLGFREFTGTKHDEVPLAEVVAKQCGAVHETRWVGKSDFVGELSRVLNAMDQPSIDGVNSYFVAKAAHEAGLKVALSGVGGDELLGGYSGFRDIPRVVHALHPFTLWPALGRGFRYLTTPILKRFTSPKYAGLFEYGGDWAGAYLLRRGLYAPWELPKMLDGDLVREGWRALQTLPALRQTVCGIAPDRLKVTALETAWYMRNQLLRDTDWASMAHSLEVRVPLVDVELFRTVIRLVRGGYAPGKREMASSPARPLPHSVLNRRKTGFSVPMREWLVQGLNDRVALVQRGLRGWATWVMESYR